MKKILFKTSLFFVLNTCTMPDTFKETIETINQVIKPGGYVRYDAFWDTRQVVADREGMGIFWPKEKLLDACGNDINANGQFNSLAIRTRLKAAITGPKIWNADSSGYIEVDFFGKSGIPNIIRMRKAYLQLAWKRTTIRLGQDWHPLYVEAAAANTISVTSGWPMQCHGRQPSAQFFFNPKPFEIILAAVTQLDGVSDGPDGPSSKYLRNAIVPNLHAQVRWYHDEHFFGVAVDWKRIKPRLSAVSPTSDLTFKVNEHNNSTSAIAFAHLVWPTWFINSKFIYSENLRDLKQLSGYAVASIDQVTGQQTYTNTRALSWWADTAITKSEKIEPGLFVGITKNIGARNCLAKDSNGNFIIFSRAPDIDYVLRIAPRARWKIKKVTFGAELEFVRASYGTITNKGKVENGVPVNDIRVHFATFYYF